MVRFTLFGIPVEIQPSFWLGSACFGGLLSSGMTSEGLKIVVFFVIAALVSVLVHEFGHALTGRRLGGGRANIVLNWCGGLAYSRGARLTSTQEFWRVFMGPGAGFLLLGAIILIMAAAFGAEEAWHLVGFCLFGTEPRLSLGTIEFFGAHQPLWWLMSFFLEVNFWWGVINLAPVLPLDGGRITEIYVRPKTLVYQIGTGAAIAVVIYSLAMTKSYYTAMMFGYFAYTNYQALQQFYGRR